MSIKKETLCVIHAIENGWLDGDEDDIMATEPSFSAAADVLQDCFWTDHPKELELGESYASLLEIAADKIDWRDVLISARHIFKQRKGVSQ